MNKKALLEAALFMSNNPLSYKQLSELTGANQKETKFLVEELKKELQPEQRGVFLLETKEGFQLRVKPEYIPSVRHLTPYQDMGKGLLRVLAFVAYKQPVTQSQIVKVIGNRTYEYVKELENRGLIRTIKHKRTKALMPTKEFAEYFGIENPEDAKKFFEKQVSENNEKGNE